MKIEKAKRYLNEMIQEVAVTDGTGNAAISELRSILDKVEKGEIAPGPAVQAAATVFKPAPKVSSIKQVHH